MAQLFLDINRIIANLSTGPTAAIVMEISSNVRYAIVQPYNFYFINNKKSIIFLLTSTRVPPNTNYNAIEFYSSETKNNNGRQNYIVSSLTINDINKYFTNNYNKSRKFILFKEVSARTIEEILNEMLSLGIFTIE